MATYCFRSIRDDKGEWGIVNGNTPEEAMSKVLGSHPKEYGVTYAFVYLPDEHDDPNSDHSLEWNTETHECDTCKRFAYYCYREGRGTGHSEHICACKDHRDERYLGK